MSVRFFLEHLLRGPRIIPPPLAYARILCFVMRRARPSNLSSFLDPLLNVGPQSAKRVAKKAADARLSSDVLREVMQACSMARKNVMRRAKAADAERRAREAGRGETSILAAERDREGDGSEGDGRPVSTPEFSHSEQFVLEFEGALGNVEGVEVPVRQSLVTAARVRA